jgi:hypothetical protein
MIECLPSCRVADKPPEYRPTRFGNYALWFFRKSYEHMASEPALPDAVVTPAAGATALPVKPRFGLQRSLLVSS